MNKSFIKKALIVIVGIVAFTGFVTAEQPWFFYYKLGIENAQNGQCDAAITALQKALELNGTPSSHARTYGMSFIEYYPYYFMALCYYNTGTYAEAQKALDTEFKAGAINASKDLFNKAYSLKGKIDSKLQTKLPSPQEPPVTKPPVIIEKPQEPPNNIDTKPPVDQKPPDNPPIGNNKPENKELLRYGGITKQALYYYFSGEYSQTISTFNQLPDGIPPPLARLKNFFLGSSYASLYYLEGEKDSNKIKTARSYFGQVDRLPPFFRVKFGRYISPKILSLFGSVKTNPM